MSSISTQPEPEPTGVDLDSCDREQVQFSEAIQPHGLLLVLNEHDLLISHASLNTLYYLGKPAASLLRQPLEAALPADHAAAILLDLQKPDLEAIPLHLGSLGVRDHAFEVFAHRVEHHIILELEKIDRHKPLAAGLYSEVRSCIRELYAAQDVSAVLNVAVKKIRALTGYDRVLAYKFMPDGTGYIQAEAKREDASGFLGLHFPPGDVPAPARRVLSLVWVRSQPDIGYVPVPLLSATPQSGPLDLSYSILRSTSAMCNRYYVNMGVHSKLVVALLCDGEMWGAVICQHERPTSIPYETRLACETVAHTVSTLLKEKERAEQFQEAMRVRQNVENVIEQVAEAPSWAASLADLLPACFASSGTAVSVGNGLRLQGITPPEAQVASLVHWLESRGQSSLDHIFSTRSLSSVFAPAKDYSAIASGLLAARLGPGEYMLWFRPEKPMEITWAGDPQKPVEVDARDGQLRLAPRTSFALHPTRLTGLAEPWLPYELEADGVLQNAVLAVRRSDQFRQRVIALTAANSDLESFAFIASHDLREPLRGIMTYSRLLAGSLNRTLDEHSHARLATIERLAVRMDELLLSLLQCSRVGQTEPVRCITDLNEIVGQAREILSERLHAPNVTLRVAGSLPRVHCDPTQVCQIFVNLIVNGLKYNDNAQKIIEIGWCEGAEREFYVRDNGIGITPENHDNIFAVFRRLHGRDEYGGGSGAGLTIVRKMVEHHGGKIRLESSPGAGSTFYFTLPEQAGAAVDGGSEIAAGA